MDIQGQSPKNEAKIKGYRQLLIVINSLLLSKKHPFKSC